MWGVASLLAWRLEDEQLFGVIVQASKSDAISPAIATE
jgi:hypothetical protein